MSTNSFEVGLARVASKETNQHKQGRSGGKVKQLKLRGDTNPLKGGGINRATQGKMGR